MSGFLAFPAPILPSHLLSATSQAGPRISGIIPAVGNVSAMKIRSIGTLTSATDPLITIGTAGDPGTAELFFSKDGGTNTLGRKLDTVWDDYASGGAGTFTRVLDWTCTSVSQFEPLDINGDGVPDRIVVAAASLTDKKVMLYESSLFSPSTFTERGTVVTKTGTVTSIDVGNIVVKNGTIIVPVFHEDTTGKWLEIYKSTDAGLTFAYSTSIHRHDTGLLAGQIPSAAQCESGQIAVAYVFNGQVRIGTITAEGQPTGTGWPSVRQISDGTGSYTKASVVCTSSNAIYVFAFKTGVGIVGWVNTSGDPNADSYSALTSLTNVTSTNYDQPGAGLSIDGHTVYLMMRKVDDNSIAFSKSTDNATYPAPTEIIDVADALANPMVGNVSGELWCGFVNTTDSGPLDCVVTQYWVTADTDPDSGTFNPAPTPYKSAIRKPIMHMGSDNLWLEITGGYGFYGSQWSGDMTYDYAAYRMILLRPSHPTKSVGSGSSWYSVFNLSGGRPFPFDTVLAGANVDALYLQAFSSDSWWTPGTTPTEGGVEVKVDFNQQTILDANKTVSGNVVALSGITLTPHALIGKWVKMGTGAPSLIIDNTDAYIYCETEILGSASADIKILSPLAWNTVALTQKDFLRVCVLAQNTAANEYSIPVVLVGLRTALASRHKSPYVEHSFAVDDQRTESDQLVRCALTGKPRRRFALEILVPGNALYTTLSAQLKNIGERPIAYVPDDTNKQEWALCYPPATIRWDGIRPMIELEESV